MGACGAADDRGNAGVGPPLRPADQVLAQLHERGAGAHHLGIRRIPAAQRANASRRPHAADHRRPARSRGEAMKPPQFEYHAPTDVGEAVQLLSALGENGRLLAGGQSLMPMLNLRLARPEAIVDLNRITALAYHRLDSETLVIGALCRQ